MCDLVGPSKENFNHLSVKFMQRHCKCWFDSWINFCRKFGYVDFSSEEDLQKALALNGKKLMGQPLKLDRARSKEDSQESKKGNVLQLRLWTSIQPSLEVMSSYQTPELSCGFLDGQVLIWIRRRAMRQLWDSRIQRFIVFLPSERDARTLFVKNLPYSVTQDDLKELFDQAVDIRVPMGTNGSSRG